MEKVAAIKPRMESPRPDDVFTAFSDSMMLMITKSGLLGHFSPIGTAEVLERLRGGGKTSEMH